MSLLLLALSAPQVLAAERLGELAPLSEGEAIHRALQALEAPGDLVEPVVLRSGHGAAVRLSQLHEGVPVLGGGAVVRVRDDGQVSLIRDERARGLSVATTPTLDRDQALRAAGAAGRADVQGGLTVLPEREGRLVWALLVPDAQGGERVLVDAMSGQVVNRRPAALDALGRVYLQNPTRTPDTSDVELTDLDSGERLTGWSGNLQVTHYLSSNGQGAMTVEQETGPNEGADFLYDPPSDFSDSTDAFAEVNAYYHLTEARDYFRDLGGLNMASGSWTLTAVTNALSGGSALDNAYFSAQGQAGTYAASNLIVIGQGSRADFAADADVFVHEFGHYVSHRAVGYNLGQFYSAAYGLSPWSGSVDEGIADYFATSMSDDPVLGEYSLAQLGAARDLSGDSGRCPDDILGEVHYDGEIIGQVSWAIREAYGAELADQIVWGAVTMMSLDSDFSDYAEGLSAMGEELLEAGELSSLDALNAALADKGLDNCEIVRDLGDGPFNTQILGLDLVGSLFGASCAQAQGLANMQSLFHFKLDTEPGDLGLQIDVAMDSQGPGNLEWEIYMREGEHVSFATQFFLPEVDEYTLVSEEFTGDSGSVLIEGEGFEGGQTWYGVIVSRSCPITVASISGEVMRPIVDSGVDSSVDTGVEEKPGSCACDGGATGASWLGLLGLLMLRRRRQTER
ncbi:MAG: M36 family metallopeptidase [Alphaproteobacteria bacterium]|nr:M36 family metallopeptidase [Alphaproteobacteria bacterium]